MSVVESGIHQFLLYLLRWMRLMFDINEWKTSALAYMLREPNIHFGI